MTKTAAKRSCGTCIWWGDEGVRARPTEVEWRDCLYPVPVWLSKGWRSPQHAGGDCATWETPSTEPVNGE